VGQRNDVSHRMSRSLYRKGQFLGLSGPLKSLASHKRTDMTMTARHDRHDRVSAFRQSIPELIQGAAMAKARMPTVERMSGSIQQYATTDERSKLTWRISEQNIIM